MQPLEKYIEDAPEPAQNVVNTWGRLTDAGIRDFTDEFKDLLNKASD